ncbi:MAG: dehydratase, partial [Mycobacterium sp.]
LRRFAVRFSKPVLPGDGLETRIWRKDSAGGITSYAFETARGKDASEELAITDGLAEITDE